MGEGEAELVWSGFTPTLPRSSIHFHHSCVISNVAQLASGVLTPAQSRFEDVLHQQLEIIV